MDIKNLNQSRAKTLSPKNAVGGKTLSSSLGKDLNRGNLHVFEINIDKYQHPFREMDRLRTNIIVTALF